MVHRNVDDASPALLHHLRRNGASHVEWPVHIRVDHHFPDGGIGFPKFGRSIEKFLADEAHAAPRVVNQDVHAAKLAQGFARHAHANFFARHIGQVLANFAREWIFCRFLRHLFNFVAIARRGQHHVRSSAREAQRHRTA